MVFVVTSVLLAWKESRQGRQKVAQGAAERNPGFDVARGSNEESTLSLKGNRSEAQHPEASDSCIAKARSLTREVTLSDADGDVGAPRLLVRLLQMSLASNESDTNGI